jgi:hypothetical protein
MEIPKAYQWQVPQASVTLGGSWTKALPRVRLRGDEPGSAKQSGLVLGGMDVMVKMQAAAHHQDYFRADVQQRILLPDFPQRPLEDP